MNTAGQAAETTGFATTLFTRPAQELAGRDTQSWHLPVQRTLIQSDESGVPDTLKSAYTR
jgi:hypothetical protein